MTRARLHHDNIGLAGRLAVSARQRRSTTLTIARGDHADMTIIEPSSIPISIRGRYFWRGDERASLVSLNMPVLMF